jgi:DNA adenine methylase
MIGVNAELVGFYLVVRDDVDALLAAIAAHEQAFRAALGQDRDRKAYKALYYALREQNPATLDAVAAAARTYVLNKLGNNGMFRVNKKGGFNVPVGGRPPRRDGSHTMPALVRGHLFRACSRALQGTTIAVLDVVTAVDAACAGEFVYIDPPYWPRQKGGFTSYARDGFGEEDQQRLAAAVKRAIARGVNVAASNHDLPEVRRLYAGMHFQRVMAPRSISSKATTRGPVPELLMTSFAPPT